MKKLSNTKKKNITSAIVLVLLVIVYFILRSLMVNGVLSNYIIGPLNLVCINVVAAVGLNMVTGMLGQLVLGHAGFMLVGAYSAALFTKSSGLSLYAALPIGILLAGVIAALFGLIIGLPALRLRGDYLAIITLGFGEIIRVLANYFKFTNGAKGLSGIPGFRSDPAGLFTFVFILAVATVIFSYTFGTSRHGRAVIAIREDEIAAEASGINTTYYKLLAFTLSAFFAGVAGALLAHYTGIIDPSKYDFNYSVEILMMVVLGGMGSITGSVLAAGVLTVLPEMLRGFSEYRLIVYSVLLILVMLFRPKGLLGRAEIRVIKPVEKLWAKLKKSPSNGEGGAKA